jgi:DNA-binding Lrp family transcriptional regulator
MTYFDKIDTKLLLELDSNSRQTNTTIAKKLKVSKQVIEYRIKRLENQHIILRFPTVINIFNLGYRKYKLFLSLSSQTHEQLDQLIQTLILQPTEWVTFGSGKFDLIVSFLVKTPQEFLEKVQIIYNKIGTQIRHKVICEVVEVPHWTKKYLGGKEHIVQGFTQQVILKPVEEQLLKLIANNSRMSILEIATKLNISPQTAINNLKKLKEQNIIQQHKVAICIPDWIYAKAFITLHNNNQNIYQKIKTYCDILPNMNHLVRCIGPWDLELDFEIESFPKFHQIMLDFRNTFAKEIKEYDYTIITKEIKLDYFPNALPELK